MYLFFKINLYDFEYEATDDARSSDRSSDRAADKPAEGNEEKRSVRPRYSSGRSVHNQLEHLNKKTEGNAYFFGCEMDNENKFTFACITVSRKLMEDLLPGLQKCLGIRTDDVRYEEVTLKELTALMSDARRCRFIESEDKVLSQFGLDDVYDNYDHLMDFEENLVPEMKRTAIVSQVKKTMYAETILPELDRIYMTPPRESCWGHPVHYMMMAIDQGDERKNTYRALLAALYSVGRLGNRRYFFFDCCPSERLPGRVLDHLYRNTLGGAVVIRFRPQDDEEEDDRASANRQIVETLAEYAVKYQNDVLTVLVIPAECRNVSHIMYEYLGGMNIVEICEERVSGEKARNYLGALARSRKVRTDKKLYARLEEDRRYRSDELRELFNEWWHEKLRTTVYPQYRNVQRTEVVTVTEGHSRSAYDDLTEMVGLRAAKDVIDKAIAYFRAQMILADKGFKSDRPSLSMVFTGNPGSCKTTVARLIAEILDDEGILETGRFVECGRGDLVARFVGNTAPMIMKKFKEAQGGVLFIDEAYSLVDDRDGSFGDEAINTIVQCMENYRNDVLVIFAGYPDKMEVFLNKNPGLRSRIAFHVPFEDYDTDELIGIAELMAKKRNLRLSPEAVLKMRGIFDTLRRQTDFGNGRAVRNILDAAKMAMAVRLLRGDVEKLTQEEVRTVLAEDISAPVMVHVPNENAHRVIGF